MPRVLVHSLVRRGSAPFRAAIAGLALAWVAPSGAAGEGMLAVVDAGAAFPVAPPEFPDLWKVGWTVGGGVAVILSPRWEVATTAHFQHFGADEAAHVDALLLSGPGGVSEIASLDGHDARTLSLTSEMRFHFRAADDPVAPFLSFGAGYFQISTTDAVVVPVDPSLATVPIPGDTDSALAATVGGGVRLRANDTLRVEVRSAYTIGFTEQSSTEYLPLRVGLAFEI